MILTRDKGSRMWGGGGTGGYGGGGGLDPSALAGYATMGWVEKNYLSKAFWTELFVIHGTETIYTSDDDGQTWTQDGDPTSVVFLPNEVPSEVITDGETAGTKVKTVRAITSIEAKKGVWTDFYLSALGQNSAGGGGGGSTTLYDLLDVNIPATLTQDNDGQVLMYNYAQNKWVNATIQQSGGTVTSITAGTGLSGGTITISGTIALSTETQTNIGYGVVAYGWGNHADAGYLTSSAISDMATQTWVTNNFLGLHATADAATKLATPSELWGRSFDGTAAVTGTLSYVGDINSNALGSINNFNKIELNAAANAGNGGAIYFHYNGMSGRASGYIINDADGLVSVLTSTGNIGLKVGTQTGDYIQIGDIRIVYDNTDNRNSLKVVKSDGTAANFYATGAVSALGSNNSGGGGTGISYKSTGNITLASNTWYRIASLAGTSNVGTSSFRIYSVSGSRTFNSKVILSLRGSNADLIKEGSCNMVIGDLRITTDGTNTYLEVKTGTYGNGVVIKADTYEDYSDLDNSQYGWTMYQSAVIGGGTVICTTSDDGRTLTFSGNVYCGGEFNSGEYYCSGQVYSEGDIATESDIFASGDVHAASFINNSDARIKDIQDYDAIIDVNTLANAPAIHFTWKEKSDTRAHVGTIAQYWQDVVPEVVTESKYGYLSMQYDVLAMLSAISVAKKVVDHETRIAELEKENELLRNKIDKLKN